MKLLLTEAAVKAEQLLHLLPLQLPRLRHLPVPSGPAGPNQELRPCTSRGTRAPMKHGLNHRCGCLHVHCC